MKHKFYLLIAFIFLILGCEIDRGKRYEHGGYYFKFLGNNSVSFCGWTESAIKNSHGILYVPKKIYDFDVVKIEKIYQKNIKSIVMLAKVEIIPEYCFYSSSNLEEITLPEGLTTISIGAFTGCIALKKITLPSTLKNIGTFAFDECSRLEIISLPEGLTTIGKGAFMECITLKKITLPSTLKSIGDYAFYKCDSLGRVTFKDTSSWYIKDIDGTNWYPIDVSDPSINAKNLQTRYRAYFWGKGLS